MATSFDEISGRLVPNKIPENLCWTNPNEFLENIQQWLGVELGFRRNQNFVIGGFETPGPDDTNKLWARVDQNGNGLGWHHFINGAWRPYCKPGEQRTLPEGVAAPEGFQERYRIRDADNVDQVYIVYEFIGY